MGDAVGESFELPDRGLKFAGAVRYHLLEFEGMTAYAILGLDEGLLGLPAFRAVGEEHGDFPAVRALEPKGVDVEPPVQGSGFVDEADGFTGQSDGAIDVEPALLQ